MFVMSTTLSKTPQIMNLDGLSPEQIKLIFDLSKRVVTLESKLTMLQDKLVRIDRRLTPELAKNITHLSLN